MCNCNRKQEFHAHAQHYNHNWYRVMKCDVIQIQPVIISQSWCFALNRAKNIHGCPLLNKYKEMRQKSKKSFHHCVHDHHMYIVCPDMLSTVGVHQIGWSPHYFLIYLFICIWGAKSALVQLIKHKSYSNNKPNHHFTPELVTCCFRWPDYEPPRSHCSLTGLPASNACGQYENSFY